MKQNQYIMVICLIVTFITGCVSQAPVVSTSPKPQEKIKQNASKTPCHLSETKSRPSWIDHPVNSSQYLFGVGSAPKQTPVFRQVQAARILAMRGISQQIQVYIESIIEDTQTQDKDEIKSKIKEKSESLLRGIKYVDQWNDVENCIIHVLASVKKTLDD
jgi:PBP1b-binding outer membrane lipoprotein LpoB